MCRRLQPCRNIRKRTPGPSTEPKLSMEWILPSDIILTPFQYRSYYGFSITTIRPFNIDLNQFDTQIQIIGNLLKSS